MTKKSSYRKLKAELKAMTRDLYLILDNDPVTIAKYRILMEQEKAMWAGTMEEGTKFNGMAGLLKQ